MDYDYPPDAPDYDDLEDLLDELEQEKQLVIDDTDIPSDIEDDGPLPSIPPTQATAASQRTGLQGSGTQSSGRSAYPAPEDTTHHRATNGTEDSAKRRLEESIFGDLSDLDTELSQQTAPKRTKLSAKRTPDDEHYDDLMERIRASRALPKAEQFSVVNGVERVPAPAAKRTVEISSRVPLTGAFQKLTFSDGSRYFLTVRSRQPQPLANPVSSRTSLLSRPLQELKDEARRLEERRQRLLQERAVLQKLASWDTDAADSGVESEDETERSSLWVQRFQPRTYVELLSDETINRGLLHWLRLWDKAVFGRDVIIKPPKEEKKKPDGKFKPFVRKPAFEIVEELDSTNRPKQKVALLCGPPGLGKTTLAHVLARHAGYSVLEMNASDDRSVTAFRTALESATQMRPMLGADPRPNCLVIDEIDGAPAPAINHLVAALSAGSGDTSSNKKKKKEGPAPIHRPVICICNDPYVPALRPLRQMALVMTFPPTTSERLASRLADICRRNGLKTDLGALLSLCEKTRNDIRSCLGFLQFVRSRQERLTLDQVQSSTVGQKDHHKSLFAAWQEIFNMPRPQRKHLVVSETDGSSRLSGDGTSLAERLSNIVSVVTSCGEHEKLAQGLFENYLNIKIKDSTLQSVALGVDWLCFGDELNAELQHSQNYVLLPYQSYTGVAFHLLFATLQKTRPAFPQADSETRQRHSKLNNLLASMISEMSPRTRCFNGRASLVKDVLPYLLQVAVPNLRPVSSQLHTPREEEELRRVLHLMVAYNLTYRQQRDAEGQYQYLLEPNMEELVYFGDERPQRSAPYTVKQLIAREIELEKMRRAEAALVGTDDRRGRGVRETAPPPAPEPAAPAAEPTGPAPAAVPNHLRQLQAKPLAERAVADDNVLPRDFFGRVIQPKPQKETPADDEAPDSGHLLRTDVWYHFKEGYNNAVRRTVRVQDLA
ncbi:chromosome transmission fidelity protein 18 homolog [Amphibalanus amphitrite]|uniref:chromosome transmission fidelity protein 18 homolog n=1 Tax=Amphibalanus amphitrite TaxID=1232801 RepID=UPI001C90EB2E|nr:chromosome transmission fidelity protein 18 homolog [Amphibalanus amphitrite]